MKTLRSALIAATMALATVEASADSTPGERQVSLVIESGTLAEALDQWARQSGFQIFVQDWEATKRLTAPSLRGTFAAQAALEQLLEATPLTYVWLNEKAVSIRRKVAPTLPTALQRSSLNAEQPSPIAKFSGDDAGSGAPALGVPAGGVKSAEALEEVIVTGSLIRGARTASPLTVVTREYIDQSGYSSLHQVLQSLPQNFGGGATEATITSPAGSGLNVAYGSSPNLRGLGADSTLVLLNGQRLAPSAYGDAVDISAIPLSAVERVEVLSDGASATYGSDAIAGVVNIILRKDYEGAETGLTAGTAARSSMNELQASQTFGRDWGLGNILVNYEFLDRDNLDAKDRDYSDVDEPFDLLPNQKRHSLLVTGQVAPSERATLKATALVSKRDSNSSTALGFDSVAQHDRSRTENKTFGLGVDFALGASWRTTLDAQYSDSTLDAHSDIPAFDIFQELQTDFSTRSLELRADGGLLNLAAGPLSAAIGAGLRNEKYNNVQHGFLPRGADRDITSAFGEIFIPLVAAASATPFIHALDATIAVRHEDYSDFGTTTNPKFGLSWKPAEFLRIRGTYGKSFRAPIFLELLNPGNVAIFEFTDPNSPTGTTVTLRRVGGNPDLRPEKATTWTAGFDLSLGESSDLSLTYFDTKFTGRINEPLPGLELFSVFSQEDVYAPLIVRDPSPELVDQIVASAAACIDAIADDAGCDPQDLAAVEAILDKRQQNLSRETVRGLDVATSFRAPMGVGTLALQLAATYLFEFEDVVARGLAPGDFLNTAYHQIDFKGRASVAWEGNGWEVNTSINYADGYENRSVSPQRAISSWTTVDLQLSYDLGRRFPAIGTTRFAVTALNLFDEDPPFVSSPLAIYAIGYDPGNANPLGRFVSLRILKEW
jgi:iron complex outermembrane recepter protein